YALGLAEAIKRRRRDIRILAGGQQATFLVEEMLGPGNIDAVVRGEGEYCLCEILAADDFRGVPGVSWRRNGNIHNEPDRPLIENLDTVLRPARDLLPERSRYRMGAYRVEGIETSRGCPHHCSFCSIRNFHRGKWRSKSVARVMQEADDILENPAPLVDGEGDTMWVSGSAPIVDPMQDFRRHYFIDGDQHHEPGRAIVLVFDEFNYTTDQSVYLYAVDDLRSEGDRVVAVQHSVISADDRFDGVAVRNVEVSLRDNDTPGMYVTEVEPATFTEDGRTLVIEGEAIAQNLVVGDMNPDTNDYTGLRDEILVELAREPDVGDVIVTELVLDADSEREAYLVHPNYLPIDTRFDILIEGDVTRYFVTFDHTDWDDPIRVTVEARDDDSREDPGIAVIAFVQHKDGFSFGGDTFTPVDADSDYTFPNLRSGTGLTDTEVIDNEAAGVVALESGTNTQLVVDDLTTGVDESLDDTYTLRLTRRPTADVDVAVFTDGLADVVKIDGVAVTPASMQVIGGYLPAQAFTGTLDIAGAVITRGEGSELGSFLDEGFVAGQLIRIALTTNDGLTYTTHDTETGKRRWRFYTDGPVRLAPVADGGKVYFASDDGHLYCVSAADGKLVWRFAAMPTDRRVVGNDRVIST
ncbi:hypothetical protein LCGC14_2174730, partial [marine sediment metagenome]